MRIRKATSKDAEEMCKVVRAAIKEVNSKDYTPRQIKAWLSHNTTKGYRESMKKGRRWFVAVERGKIAGVARADSENETIKALYVNPRMHGKGIGKKLYLKMEKFLRAQGVKKLVVESTITAQKFYKKMGMKKTGKRNVKMSGVKIPVVVMEKKIR